MHDEFDEANLMFLHAGHMSVAHRRDLQAEIALLIALPPELLHDPVRPFDVDVQRLGGIRQVGAVDHVLKDLNAIVVGFEHDDVVARDLLRFDHGLQVGQELHVLGHVRGENHVNDHLAQGLQLLRGEMREDVALVGLQQFEGNGEMMILQDALVVVHKCEITS